MARSAIDDVAVSILIGDLIENILGYSNNPGGCADYITTQIRELVGVRSVALIEIAADATHANYATLSVCPSRNKSEWESPARRGIISALAQYDAPCMLDPVADMSHRLTLPVDFGKAFIIPLVVGSDKVGLIILQDLLDEGNAAKALEGLTKIAGVISLILRNSVLYRNMEQAVIERTGQLATREKEFRALFERSTIGKAMTATDGRLLRINRAFAEMLGYAVEEMSQLNFAEFTHPDDTAKSWGAIRVLLAGEQTEYQMEKRYIHKTGGIVWADVRTTLLCNDQGVPLYFITSVLDITKRKEAEGENRRLQERLNRAEKMEALGLLAGGVAHDLNNVLGVVVGYAEMLLEGVDKKSTLGRGLTNVMNGGLRAAAIVDDLLSLARRGVQSRTILNINKIVEDCRKSPEYANLLSHHPAVKVITDLDVDLLNISGSPVHLGKTLYNLLSNAAEAMPQGGTVAVKTANQYLEKPLQGYDQIRRGDYVVLSVSDTGGGIAANDLARIFEPFYTKKIMGRSGTGLGLAVVWGTVKDHHGYINVESEEGKGSVFMLYFPVSREEVVAESPGTPLSEYMGRGESILVVDDVAEQRELAAGMLRSLNYLTATAAGGEAAVAYLQEHVVDLLVLDMIMDPGMDGLDTYKSVLALHPRQKAIIVSGFSESERVRAASRLGAGAYVQKPYIKEKLGLAVRKELERQR